MKFKFILVLVPILVFATGCIEPVTENGVLITPQPTQIMVSPDLKIEDLKTGDGTEATAGKSVTVHYTGTLTNGTKFDSSLDRGEPFTFKLGAGEVIAGWDQGVQGMKVGGKRKLTIPPQLGYGDQSIGDKIPAGSTLVFEVELLEVK